MTEVRINVADLRRLEDEAQRWKDNYREVNISLMQAGEKINNLVALLGGRMEVTSTRREATDMEEIRVMISVAKGSLVRMESVQHGFWKWLADQLAYEIATRMQKMTERDDR